MDGTGQVLAAAVAFVGTHFLLSHPLRRPIVARFGEHGFAGVYALVAFATLGWLVLAYRAAPVTAPLWDVGDGLWALVAIVMLIASVLLMGSLIGNPALPGPPGDLPAEAKGVFAVTRHPMMWGFALWGLCHIAVFPVAANIIVAGAITFPALVGARLQDAKKQQLQPDRWRAWETKTSYWPFAAIAAGRTRFGGFRPHDIAGGLVIWLAATWAHIPLAGMAAGCGAGFRFRFTRRREGAKKKSFVRAEAQRRRDFSLFAPSRLRVNQMCSREGAERKGVWLRPARG